jgi:hypothetical protein
MRLARTQRSDAAIERLVLATTVNDLLTGDNNRGRFERINDRERRELASISREFRNIARDRQRVELRRAGGHFDAPANA